MQSHYLLSSFFIFYLSWLTNILARNEPRNGNELGPYNYGNGERGARIFKVNGDGHGNGNNNWRPPNPTTPRPPANPPNIVPPPSYEETMARRAQQQINLPFQHDRVHLQGHLPQGYNRPMPVFPPNEQQFLQSLVDQSKEQSRLGVDAIGVSDFEQWMGRPRTGAQQPSRTHSRSPYYESLTPSPRELTPPNVPTMPKKRIRPEIALLNIANRDQPPKKRRPRPFPQNKEDQKVLLEHYLKRNPEFAKELDRRGPSTLTRTNLNEVWNDAFMQGIRGLHSYGGVTAVTLGDYIGRDLNHNRRGRYDYELSRRGVELFNENVGRRTLPASKSNHEHMRRELDAHLDRLGRGESPLPPPIDARTLGEQGLPRDRRKIRAEELESAIAAVGKPDSRKRRKSPMRSDIVYDPNNPREGTSSRTGRSQGDQRSRFSSTSFDRVAFDAHLQKLAEDERKRRGQGQSSANDVPGTSGTSSQMHRNQQQQQGGSSAGAGSSQQQQQASTSQHHRSRGSAGLNAPQQQQARSPLPPKVPTKSPSPKRKRPRSPPKRQKREAQFG